jgi:uncharacterized protein (TIGR03437 family)
MVTADQAATVTASALGVSKTSAFTLVAPPQISSLACSPLTLASRGVTSCTVTLNKAAASRTVIPLTSSNPTLLPVPASAIIPAGLSGASFSLTAGTFSTTQNVTVTGSLNGQSRSATLTLMAAGVSLTSLSCVPASVNAPGYTNCTVSLSGPAPVSAAVSLASDSSAITVPPSVTINAGQSSASYFGTVSAATADKIVNLTASYGGSSKSFGVWVLNPPQLSSVKCTPGTLGSNQYGTCTVTTGKNTSSTLTVTLRSDQPNLILPLPTILITAGSKSKTFPMLSLTVTKSVTATITAAAGSAAASTTVSLSANKGGANNSLSLNAPSDLTVRAKSGVSFTAKASDSSGQAASVAVSRLPSGAGFDPGTGTFRWRPSAEQTGNFEVALTASDAEGNTETRHTRIRVVPSQAAINGLYNPATLQPMQACSPGATALLAGSGFTTHPPEVVSEAPWPGTLGGVKLKVNGAVAPLLAVSDDAVYFQCPVSNPGESLALSLEPESGEAAREFRIGAAEATPSLYRWDDHGQGAVLIAGTDLLAMPSTNGVKGRPVKREEGISIFANGLGRVEELLPPGTAAPTGRLIRSVDPVTIVLGAQELELTPAFAGLAPGSVGLFQVNAVLSREVPAGDSVPVYLRLRLSDGSAIRSNTITIAIQDKPAGSD